MAELTQAQGSLTIVDFNDAPMLQGALEVTSGVTTQIYRTDSSSFRSGHDWAIDNITIMPRLYKSGVTPVEVCADNSYIVTVVYEENISVPGTFTTINAATNTDFTLVGATNRYGIKIVSNILGLLSNQGVIRAKITYTDSITGLSTTSIVDLNINIFATQSGAVALIITSNNGYTFKNAATSSNEDITLTATLMRGSTEDTTNLTYVWKQDDVVVGGNTSTLTISAVNVYSKATILCTVSDSVDVGTYTATVSILDVTDPIQVNISSDIGNVFKIGAQTTARLSVLLYQSGSPITAPVGAGFLWALDNKDGADAAFTGNTSVSVGPLTGAGTVALNYIAGLTTVNLKVGYLVTGTGVPVGTRINRIADGRVYITNTITASSTSYTFTLPVSEKATTVNYIDITDADITVRGTITCKVLF